MAEAFLSGLAVGVVYSEHRGHTVSINGKEIYFRPYDGVATPEVLTEFVEALGDLVRVKLSYQKVVEIGCGESCQCEEHPKEQLREDDPPGFW